jgi:hypothetical protein
MLLDTSFSHFEEWTFSCKVYFNFTTLWTRVNVPIWEIVFLLLRIFFVAPYLAWIQRHVMPSQLTLICNRLDKILKNGEIIQKDALDLNLTELERQLDNSESLGESDESTSEGANNDGSSNSSYTDAEDGQHFSQGKANSTELLDSELIIASARTGNLDEAELAEKKRTRKVIIEKV